MNATMLACDEIRFEATGKLFIIGMHPGNIAIIEDGAPVGQLIFLFSVDCELDVIPKEVVFEVALPGAEPQRTTVSVTPPEVGEGHTRWFMRHAMGVQNQPLRAGKIAAKVTADGNDPVVSAPWIKLLSPQELTALSLFPTASPPPPAQSPRASRAKAKKP